MRPLIYSIWAKHSFLVLCLFLGGCAGRGGRTPAAEQASIIQSRLFLERFGVIQSKEVQEYLEYMQRRLVDALPPESRIKCQFFILNAREPLAVSMETSEVAVSRGLILSLQNEAELAFILAHEVSHHSLGHTGGGLAAASPQQLQELELTADRNAVGLVILAGYDPRAAFGAVLRAYRNLGLKSEDGSHPSPNIRLAALQSQIEKYKWRPPGTINRRDFQKLKAALR